MTLIFWFSFFFTSVTAASFITYLAVYYEMGRSYVVNSSGYRNEKVVKPDLAEAKAQAKMWAFGVGLIMFALMSGLTACFAGNHSF